jgi:RNA polymerase subunit RPABC4/transcription elongation factor Spt4
MISTVENHCPRCGASVDVPYILLGATATCPSCGQHVVTQVAVGASYPNTRFEMTFADFEQLVRHSARGSHVDKLLSEWYGHRLVTDGNSSAIVSHGGEVVDLLDLHKEIQGDPLRQRALYRTAMAVWR